MWNALSDNNNKQTHQSRAECVAAPGAYSLAIVTSTGLLGEGSLMALQTVEHLEMDTCLPH